MRPRRALIVPLSLILSGSRPASAEPDAPATLPLELSWTAPAGCPSEQDVTAQIARLSRAARAGGRLLRASAGVEQTENGAWRVTLETSGPGGAPADSRALVGDSCEAVAGSVAVVLALRLDSSEEPPPPREPAPEPAPPSGAPAPLPAEGPRGFSLGAAIAADSSALPHATLGAVLQTAVQLGATQLGLQGTYWIPRELDLGDGKVGTFRLWTVAVMGCHTLLEIGARSGFAPCVALEAGAMSAESSGVRVPGRTTEPWLAARAGGRLSLRLGRSAGLWLAIDVAAPLRRPSFVVEGLATAHRPGPLSARAFLGAEWWF